MKLLKLLKLSNREKTLIAVLFLFLTLFSGSFGLIAYAQYDGDFDGYYYQPTFCDCYDYYDYDYSGDYDYDYYDYTDYYPIIYEIYDYPSASYPSGLAPSIPSYPATAYQNYAYPSGLAPGIPSYPATTYQNYAYPSGPSGNYYSVTTPSALAASAMPERAMVVHAQSVSAVPTGPDGMLPWIFVSGLILSFAVYFILFKFRFKLPFTFSSNYNSDVLKKRLEEIKGRELTPDTNDF